MVIEKNQSLYSLAGNWQLTKGADHLRIGAEGGKTGFKIPTNNPDAAYDAVRAGLSSNKRLVNLDGIDEVPAEEAAAEEDAAEEDAPPAEDTSEESNDQPAA